MTQSLLLANEAIAWGAIHAGLSAAYAYPGTPSTEIVETLIQLQQSGEPIHASWSANEKTAYEEALGVSFVGRRALVAMKHVGLNVAADPFMSSALTKIHGGLVLVVADDPGMHSSQNEQDSRYYAEFAHILCLEPSTAQEAYLMTREAFDLSERFHLPVMLRMVTRVAHSRSLVEMSPRRSVNPLSKVEDAQHWILMPMNARRQWRNLLSQQPALLDYSESCHYNHLNLAGFSLGVVTTGVADTYFREIQGELDVTPSHLHIGSYPLPVTKLRQLVEHVDTLLFLEDGYPFVERKFLGLLSPDIRVKGRVSGHVPLDGELTPERVRAAFGLPVHQGMQLADPSIVSSRPPQLCAGCPHIDTFEFIKLALTPYNQHFVASDVGCYTLGALPPYEAIETCVCMGSSIGMAKGAAEAGFYPVVATIGDSTFLHSGMPSLLDAVAANTNMTLVIMDNEVVAMTGGQPSLLPSSRMKEIVLGLGVSPEHVHVIYTHRSKRAENLEIAKQEIAYPGLSVIIAVRECVETMKRHKQPGCLS